jgi:hypothetical protein
MFQRKIEVTTLGSKLKERFTALTVEECAACSAVEVILNIAVINKFCKSTTNARQRKG